STLKIAPGQSGLPALAEGVMFSNVAMSAPAGMRLGGGFRRLWWPVAAFAARTSEPARKRRPGMPGIRLAGSSTVRPRSLHVLLQHPATDSTSPPSKRNFHASHHHRREPDRSRKLSRKGKGDG